MVLNCSQWVELEIQKYSEDSIILAVVHLSRIVCCLTLCFMVSKFFKVRYHKTKCRVPCPTKLIPSTTTFI